MKTAAKTILGRKIHKILLSDSVKAEFLTGWITLGLGLIFLYPGETFKWTSYSIMLKVMPENIWGVIMSIAGLLQLWAVIEDSVANRKTSTLTMVIVWLFIFAFLAYASSFNNTLWFLALTMWLLSVWNYYQTEVRVWYDREHSRSSV